MVDADENAAGSAAKQLLAVGHKAVAVGCDVSNKAAVAAMVQKTIYSFGQLDFAFNNAGIQVPVGETADVQGRSTRPRSPTR